jgi:hypothetical protein
MNVMELFWFIGGMCMGVILGEMLVVGAFVKWREDRNG